MRKNEDHIFDTKRTQGKVSEDFDRFFAQTLGVSLEPVCALGDELLDDLSDQPTFGIKWWQAHSTIGDKQRILIGDALCQAVLSIVDNMIEAKLHLFESLDWWELERKHMKYAVSVDELGNPRLLPLTTARQGLDQRMIHLHAVGFFRAINSALDCLGAAIIGVAALPASILKADLGRARDKMRAIKAGSSPGEIAQVDFRQQFDQLVSSAGPAGWLQWTSDFRNMVTHRGRRMQFGHLHVEPSQVTDKKGRHHPIARVERSLPADPGRCEVDATRAERSMMLQEHSRETLEGVLGSTVYLVENTCSHLLEFWRKRRNSPSMLEQPATQWPDTTIPASAAFEGYSGKLLNMGDPSVSSLVMNPSDIRRLAAAALLNDNRKHWATFT